MNPSVDLFGVTERLHYDSKSRCQEANREPGGGGINVARNLRRLGTDALAIFPCGGFNGPLLKQMLADEEVDCQVVDVGSETRQNLAITEQATGKMLHFVFPGPELKEPEWQACLKATTEVRPVPEYLVLSGSLPAGVPVDFHGRVAQAAAKQGIKVILDTSGPALDAPARVGVHLAKLNRKEFAQMGYSGEQNHQEQLAAMGNMVEDGIADILIVTLGAEGALLASRDGDRLHAAPPPTEVVSHVGAGDGFVAVMVYQLQRGKSVREAFHYGAAAAAAAIKTPGTRIQDMQSIEDLYRQMARAQD